VSDEDDVPGWEMQQDNEARRRAEEQAAMNRCRRLTADSRTEQAQFERDMKQLNESIRSATCQK
jgi:hypothetical protein